MLAIKGKHLLNEGIGTIKMNIEIGRGMAMVFKIL